MSTANTADSLPEDYRVFNFERPEERDRWIQGVDM